ncbi:hypothetical protein F4780DRAFT_105636 [Xylariomycetidae sp. FL0641]|nr:hypothetical protein F4780DRAFT_105636 [Xylariomycetidae sp. FL0641]
MSPTSTSPEPALPAPAPAPAPTFPAVRSGSSEPLHQQQQSPAAAAEGDDLGDRRTSVSSHSSRSLESGEASSVAGDNVTETASDLPPLPNEPPPPVEDDGWEYVWDYTHQAYAFHNRITDEWTWENPRVPQAAAQAAVGVPEPPRNEELPAGGYNPAIHGDYDPNAWYAKKNQQEAEAPPTIDPAAAYAAIGSFNRFTGRWQAGDHQNPERHTDEAKSYRQQNAFFDVDAAANSHDGRSLKAERSGKKPTRAELKHFKEKRRAKKEEKRRAWLRD